MTKSIAKCKTCGSSLHYAAFCYQTRKEAVRKIGKQARHWIFSRSNWIAANEPTETLESYKIWRCHYCLIPLVNNAQHPLVKTGQAMYLTLDHILARSRHPSLRYDDRNIVPACYPDNRLKGSTSYIDFCRKYYPQVILDQDLSWLDELIANATMSLLEDTTSQETLHSTGPGGLSNESDDNSSD